MTGHENYGINLEYKSDCYRQFFFLVELSVRIYYMRTISNLYTITRTG